MRLEQIRGTSTFDYVNAEMALYSIRQALDDLQAAADRSGGEVVWASMAINFEVRTITDHTITNPHPTIHPGRSTVEATATAVFS